MSSALDHDESSALRFPSSLLTTFGQFVAFAIPEIFRNPELKSRSLDLSHGPLVL